MKYLKEEKQKPMMQQRKPRRKQDDDNQKKDDTFQWQKASRTFFVWLLIIIMMIWFSRQLSQDDRNVVKIEYDQFKELLVDKKIKSAIVKEHDFHGKLREAEPHPKRDGETFEDFITTLPPEGLDINVADEWIEQYGIKIKFEEKFPHKRFV